MHKYGIIRISPSKWVMVKYVMEENGIPMFNLCTAYSARNAVEYMELQKKVRRINEVGFSNYITEENGACMIGERKWPKD